MHNWQVSVNYTTVRIKSHDTVRMTRSWQTWRSCPGFSAARLSANFHALRVDEGCHTGCECHRPSQGWTTSFDQRAAAWTYVTHTHITSFHYTHQCHNTYMHKHAVTCKVTQFVYHISQHYTLHWKLSAQRSTLGFTGCYFNVLVGLERISINMDNVSFNEQHAANATRLIFTLYSGF